MGKVEGTPVWTYTLVGVVPPGVTREQTEGTVVANIAVLGSLLPFVCSQGVAVRDATPSELAGLGGGRIRPA